MKLAGEQRALFVSDMHLGAHDPATADWFLNALASVAAHPASRPSHLFLLGDLFEAWVGDDDPDEYGQALRTLLARLAGSGLAIYLMVGNRDFLLGRPLPALASWPSRAGAQLLKEPFVLDLFGTPTVLCHGDGLCTQDEDYQHFRRMVRADLWQAGFLAKPLAERQTIAAGIRNQSEKGKSEKPPAWMDATEQAVGELFALTGTRQMIHGHTHRPGTHVHLPAPLAGASAPPDAPGTRAAMRHVLPDWQAPEALSGAPGRGYFLCFDRDGQRLIPPSS